ncbi:unnamed protein product [Paramecium pentaurelia]|uniref:WD40-repeat-containing domain n=1 Tax=Paramecium pentaurelia TaxID=43138 RepID=A0A8S1V3I0_9CILI|nr:unnamed protein product [Paramecium pentaurelia]
MVQLQPRTLQYAFLDQQSGSKFLGFIQISLDLILKSTLNYITTSGYLCIELFSLCNMLVRVLFSYYNCFQKKKLNSNFKECLENYLAEFENTVKSNVTQCWEFGIEFELEIMNTTLAHIPTKLEGPNNLTLGINQSIFKFEINDALIQSIFEYAKEILKRFVGKVRNPIKKYEYEMEYHYVNNSETQIQNIKIELQNLYIQFIKNSQDWILYYCWIKMISDFLTYRPIVDINILLQDIRNPFERRKKWKDLIKNQCIEQLPYNINLAKCICFPNKSNVLSRNLFLREYSEIGLTELSEFQQYLMKLNKQPDQQFWQFYIIYNKEKENQKDNELNQINQQIQHLFNFIPIFQQFLDYLQSLLEKNQSIIQKMNKLIQNLKNEQNDADTNYKSEILDQNSKIQINTIEMIYVINEINLHIILMTYKLSFITNSLIMENISVFSDIVDNIKNQYQMQFLTLLNLLPKNLMEFFKTKFNWQDALNNDFNRNSIQNPFDNIPNYPLEQLRILSENILEKGEENINFKKKQIEILKQSWLNQEKFNLSQIQYKQVLQILKEKVINKKSFKKKLILLIQISAQYDMIQVASNIISVLGFITKDLSNIHLSGIRLQNTSLIGIDFSNSDLSKSIFYNVNISDCNFTGSTLNNAEWQNIINYNIQREIQNCHSLFQFYQQKQMVIYSTGKKFMQLGLENGQQPLEIFESYQNLNCYDISNDGQNIAYTLEHNVFERPCKQCIHIVLFKITSLLASGGNDNKIIIRNLQKESIITEIDIISKKLKNLVFSYNNDYIALHFTTEFIQLNSGDKWTPLKGVNNLQEKITVFAFSFDQMMASVSSTDNKSQIIWLFNLKQKEKERKLKGHRDKINYLLFLSDKRSLISGGDDFFIMLWNYQTGELKGRVQKYTHKIQFLNISKNNRILGYYNQKKSISFIDLDAFQSVHQLKHPSKEISQILFSKDGLILVSCNQSKNITLWDMKGGKQMRKIKEKHDNNVIQIAFTQNGKFLAYAVKKEIILLKKFQDDASRENGWETKETIKKIKFSKDEKYLAYLCEEDDSEITLIPQEGNLDKKNFQNKNNQQKIKILDFCFAYDSQILNMLKNLFLVGIIWMKDKNLHLNQIQQLNVFHFLHLVVILLIQMILIIQSIMIYQLRIKNKQIKNSLMQIVLLFLHMKMSHIQQQE